MTTEPGIDAVIEVDAEANPPAVDVWILEPSSQRFRLSRVVLDASATPVAETLAIRAIEVLRSNFVEIDLAARRSEAPVAPPARTDAPSPPPPRTNPQFGFEAGVAVLGWGQFVTVVINFLILAFVIFLIIRQANKIKKADAAAGPSEVELLAEIRDELRKR